MKIKKVTHNNRRKAFEVAANGNMYCFPYAKLEVQPSSRNRITEVLIDRDFGNEAFTYRLASGEEGTVHIDHILEYNQDPNYLRDLLLYKLTLEAQRRVESSSLSKRELIRRLGTSAAEFYRLLDQTNYKKSVGQLLSLLYVLDYNVDLVVRRRVA